MKELFNRMAFHSGLVGHGGHSGCGSRGLGDHGGQSGCGGRSELGGPCAKLKSV